ncbi:MAG TPA: AzlD domain-containing protein [Actinomycetaceae bacterium]|nr:AzlD domain-containing protein [Actinomycetaceae bacterium]
MSWGWLLLACAVAYATKLLGYLVPVAWLDHEPAKRASEAVTVGLLAALVVVASLAEGPALVIDARLAALGAAAIALWCRAPFLVVVLVGAAAAALTRLLGFG